jgi:hypothetical protein
MLKQLTPCFVLRHVHVNERILSYSQYLHRHFERSRHGKLPVQKMCTLTVQNKLCVRKRI